MIRDSRDPALAARFRGIAVLPTSLLLILAVSLLLNTWGITWGLPQRWHPDEQTQRAENMVGEPSLNPHIFVYGCFHDYVIAAFAVLPVKVPNKLLHLMDYDTQTTLVVMLSRLLSALLGTSVVFLTFLLGNNLFDRRTGLVAAALLATSMLFVNLSHFATVDVPSLFWFTLSCVFATYVRRGGSPRSYYLAGLCSGLCAAVKYVGAISIVALVAAHYLRPSRRHGLLVAALFMAPLGFVLGTPLLLFAPLEFTEGFLAEIIFTSARGLGLSRAFFPLILQLKDALGPPIFLLSIAGFTYGVRLLARKETRASVILIFSMMLPYYFAVGSMRGPRAGPFFGPLPPLRYTLPLVPFALLLAAKMVSDLLAARRLDVRRLTLALFVTAISYSLLHAAVVDLEFTHDSRYTAREWIVDNLPAGAVIETTSYGPDVPHDRFVVVERPHDYAVDDVAASVSDRQLHLQTFLAKVRDRLATAGLPARSRAYIPWFQRATTEYETTVATFDTRIQGIESRAPDVLLVSDLYFSRFADRSSAEAQFFRDLFAGKSSYHKVAEFHYQASPWLDPPAEFVNPKIYAFSRRGSRPD